MNNNLVLVLHVDVRGSNYCFIWLKCSRILLISYLFMVSMKYKVDTEGLFLRELEGRLIVVDIDTGQYFSFNCIAQEILDGINKSMSSKEIINLLVENYKIERSVVEDDFENLINSMLDLGLLSIL